MNNKLKHRQMIETVAIAIGEDFISQVAFVGGCTTGLLLDDQFSMEQVRHTDDVDLIVHVIGRPAWYQLQDMLKQKGFKETNGEGYICTMKLGELSVDFMPDDETILGFSNQWYVEALRTAQNFQLNESITIRLVLPLYFIATKFEAYLGRGNNDALTSRDIEDILTLIDGRTTIVEEILSAPKDVLRYISEQFKNLLNDRNFEFAVGSVANHNSDREDLIFSKITSMIDEEN